MLAEPGPPASIEGTVVCAHRLKVAGRAQQIAQRETLFSFALSGICQ